MSPLLSFALEAAIAGGKSTLAWFQTGVNVDRKSDASPVTIADKTAERIIRERIAQAYPHHGILGEEEGSSGSESERWIIDPIDGTKSFVAGVPMYSTLLSFERDSIPLVGVIYFPALNEIVYAERGQGCSWNGRPTRVSTESELKNAILACGGHASMAKAGHSQQMEKLAKQVLATRTWGDAYGHALVATGRAQAMIDPVVQWYDVSAVQVVIEEAGGRFTNFAGGSEWRGEAISTNEALHDAILGAFRD